MAEHHIFLFTCLLFCLGLAMVLVRRDTIRILIGIEFMLNAANVLLVTTARQRGTEDGSALALFLILIGVCEAAVGLAIFLRAYRTYGTNQPQ